MQKNDNTQINGEFIEELYKASLSIVYNEVKSHYLLGDTTEFDTFEPTAITVENASAYDIFRLASCEYVGYKIAENEELAEKHWLMASSKNEPNAILEYSVCLFENGKHEEGFKCLLKASKLGNAIAIFRTALCYLNGIGCAEDVKKGTDLLKMLAEKNEPNALYFYSTMLEFGSEEIKADKQKSKELLQKSFELGSSFAKTDVGLKAYMAGKTNEERADALRLVEEGAEDGDVRAMCIMAIVYAKGENGVPADIEKSQKYLALSYEANFPIAVKIVEEAKKYLKNVKPETV